MSVVADTGISAPVVLAIIVVCVAAILYLISEIVGAYDEDMR